MLMLHPISFPYNSSHCTWTSSHEMLRPYILKPFNFLQTLSKSTGTNFGISQSNSIGCTLRIPPIMVSQVSTAVTTQQQPVSTQEGSTQNAAPQPLQVNPVSSCSFLFDGRALKLSWDQPFCVFCLRFTFCVNCGLFGDPKWLEC